MKFEYNRSKSKINKNKHGVDFEEAKTIWIKDNIVIPAVTVGGRKIYDYRENRIPPLFLHIYYQE